MEGYLPGGATAAGAAKAIRGRQTGLPGRHMSMDADKDKSSHGLRESEVALDLTRLKNWSNFEETAYRDFSQQRAERRSVAHRRMDESRRAGVPVPESVSDSIAAPVATAQEAVRPAAPPAPAQAAAAPQPAAPAPTVLAENAQIAEPVSRTAPVPVRVPVRAPMAPAKVSVRTAVAVYSPAGGVGKSTICAHLARSLYARGERVLLVDGSGDGMLSTYFGATEERAGLRQFCAPGESHASVLVMSREEPDAGWLQEEIAPLMTGVDRTIFDLGHSNSSLTDEVLSLCQVLLVPVVPGQQSAMAISRVAARLDKLRAHAGACPRVFFLVNRFNEESEQDRRAIQALQEQFGEEIAPVRLERSEEVEYAFAERMTISDFHTTAPLAQQYEKLAAWLRKLLPPSTPASAARRWSEV
jgi:cellulose biosynthesis protein BcsQ